jgi:hypothetical protein
MTLTLLARPGQNSFAAVNTLYICACIAKQLVMASLVHFHPASIDFTFVPAAHHPLQINP